MTAVLYGGALALAAALLAWGGRLFFRQDRLIFRPVSPLSRTPADIRLDFEQKSLTLADGSAVEAWWLPCPGAHRAVIFFHGSESALSRELPTAHFLHRLGVAALLVEYPGYGRVNGRPTEQGCYTAAAAAYSFVVREKGFAPADVILFGHSLGTAVATHLARERPVGGLVLHSAFTSVPDLAARRYPFLPVRPFLRTRMNIAARLPRCPGPVLLIHSTDDEHIPVAHAEKLLRLAPRPRRLVRLRGSHFGRLGHDEPAVRAAWQQLLAGDFAGWE